MITNKTHKRIIENKDKTISDYLEKILKLEQEIREAKDLKTILEKLSSSSLTADFTLGYSSGYSSRSIELPDNVLVHVDDLLGGKVIKQEGNKCLVIEKDGTVKTGLTKEKMDKGYSYKLLRK